MKAKAQRLDELEFRQEAEPMLRRIFESTDSATRPFLDSIDERLILRDDTFFLWEDAFLAVSHAAEAIGEDHMLYTILRSGSTPEKLTWRLPLNQYDEYDQADVAIVRKERIGFTLDRVLYSPTGEWGILFPELYALMGGSRAFVAQFKEKYPRWPQDTEEFIEDRRRAHLERGVDVSWVSELLKHIYGENAPKFEV